MHQVKERRRHVRRYGEGLAVLIDGHVFPLVDISIAGVSFQATGHATGDLISMKIAELKDLAACVDCEAKVISTTEAVVHAEFLPTMPLMRYIIAHIGDVTGVAPTLIR